MTPRFPTLFWRQVLRHSWRRPFLSGLNILSIALGITVFLAIQMANRGALASFRNAVDFTTGRADLEIRGSLPETILPTVSAVPGVRVATPLVEGVVARPGQPGEYLRILGVDLFTGAEIFPFQLTDKNQPILDWEQWLGRPDVIAVSPDFPTRGPLQVLAGSRLQTLQPAYVLQTDSAVAQGDSRLAVMDIGWAQELLGQAGWLSSIQVRLEDPDAREAVMEQLRRIVPADASVAPPATRSAEMETMLAAFQLNLMAMSLVSIIVGMFLIYNSVSASVVRRNTEIAILRANGVTRAEVRSLFLGEAACEAVIGAVIALLIAPEIARWMVQPLSLSISSLYEVVRIEHLELALWQIPEAFLLALVAATIAAWLPASEAARCDPARILHPGSGREVFPVLRRRRLVEAFLLLVAAAGCSIYSLQGGSKYLGFVAAGAVIAGFSLLAPWLALAVTACFRSLGLIGRLASDHLTRSLHRNAITIAALAAAVAMTISVTVMIHSFRASVQRWIAHTLIADLYFAPASNDLTGANAFLPVESVTWARQQPGVEEIATFRESSISFRNQPVSLVAIEGQARGELEFLKESDLPAAEELRAGRAAAVSESFATRFGVEPGQSIALATPRGLENFLVAGVYRDFARDRGTILMHRDLFNRYWSDERFQSLAVKLKPGQPTEKIADAFRAQFGREGQFAIYDNAALRGRVFQIFDQTFAVTSALRAIAVFVAITGILFSLSVLVMEREREIGVLRAIGASRPQVLGIFLGETALIGLTSSLLGVISGAVLAMILTWVVNKAFFGWTIALSYPLSTLAATPLWIIPAAVLAALIPAWRAARVAPASAVRFE